MLKGYRKPLRKKIPRRLFFCLIMALLLVLGVVCADAHIMPLVQEYTQKRAEWFATRAVNEAVSAVLADGTSAYGDFIRLTTAEDNSVTSLTADTSAVNRMKSKVSLAVLERVGEKQKIQVSIPLGTLLGSRYFTGRGPFIHIPVGMSGSVLTDIKSEFVAVGVNQTRHRLVLEVKTFVFAAVPTAHTSVLVDSSFIIAESVLLGKIPEAYTVVENIDEETVGEIFDYGAQLKK